MFSPDWVSRSVSVKMTKICADMFFNLMFSEGV